MEKKNSSNANSDKNPPVLLLWTGGWDSTFRLLYLLLVERRSVQPVYVIDYERRGRWAEMAAMNRIIEKVSARIPEGAVLFPRKMFVRQDYPDIEDLKNRYDHLVENTRVGSQYYWLAVVAELEGLLGAELCMPKHEMPSGLQDLIFLGIEENEPRLRSSWEAELFKYWSFPCLTIEKKEMRKIAEKYGFMDILRMRWFCFNPFNGKACGKCRPCRIAQEESATDGIVFVTPFERWVSRKLRKILRAS